jgi:RNA polymerase sigma factor (sigma-70 family)
MATPGAEPDDQGSEPVDNLHGFLSGGGRLAPAVVQALYGTHGDEIRLFLLGLLRDRELADEALQNTFQRVLEQGHTARTESLQGWLFKVSYHEAMALKRRQATQDRVLRKYGDREVRPHGSQVAGEPELRLIREEDLARLRQALDQLPAEQRQVVERRIDREQTFAVIAQELQLPLGTVLTRMRLALEKLHRQMQDTNESP